jgi:hypothetical protein
VDRKPWKDSGRGTAIQPYRRVANLRKLFCQSMAAVFFSPSCIRREKASSCRKRICAIAVAFSLPQDFPMQLMFDAAPAWATRPKRLTFHGNSHHAARHWRRAPAPHAAQVLQATIDFEACAAARRAMGCKRFRRRSFSSRLRAARLLFAFGLPQRLKFAARPVNSAAGRRAIRLKPFNRRPISRAAPRLAMAPPRASRRHRWCCRL